MLYIECVYYIFGDFNIYVDVHVGDSQNVMTGVDVPICMITILYLILSPVIDRCQNQMIVYQSSS